jgi:hypothetical protein
MILVFLVIGGMLFHANSCHHNSYDYDCAAMAMIATTVVLSGPGTSIQASIMMSTMIAIIVSVIISPTVFLAHLTNHKYQRFYHPVPPPT